MTTPPADVLATYTRVRETQRALSGALMKSLSKKGIKESARRLGFLDRGRLVADGESDLDLVMDTAIYDYYPTGNKNAVARFAAQRDFTDQEKTVLHAMLRARFTLVEIGEPVEGVGVQAHDIVFDERFLLADIALSRTAVPGLVIATRLLALDSFSMTTGVHLVIDDGLASVMARSCSSLAGVAAALTPRDSSFLARFFLRIGMLDPEDARIALADIGAAQLSSDDPRRDAYARLRG